MRIVILDGYTVNPGDLDWKEIEALGDLTVYDRSHTEDVFERAKDADIIVSSKIVFDKKLLDRLSKLKYIGVIATGYNVVDTIYAKEKHIIVTNVPKYCNESVAQMTFALIFELSRRVGHHYRVCFEGKWARQEDFCFWDYPQIELNNMTLGLIGCGNIGREVAKIADAIGMKVIAYDKHVIHESTPKVKFCELDEVLKESDIISLHCPLTSETKEMINKKNISKMKKSAFLINTSRGPLIKEEDLAIALNDGRLGGAGLDVLQLEPPKEDNPLLKAKNCIITPHIAWSAFEARKRLIKMTADNIKAFLNHKPINVVNL